MKAALIQNKIYEVRGEKVMLDFDLAKLYEVETRVLNQALNRNIESFPKDFMFKLTAKEWKQITSQLVLELPEKKGNLKSQSVISSWGGRRSLPYVFTEHGVTMLASILKSPKARKMNIAIIRAFIALKKFVNKNTNVLALVQELKDRVGEHDVQLSSIYDAIENLLEEKVEEKVKEKDWNERKRIGFNK